MVHTFEVSIQVSRFTYDHLANNLPELKAVSSFISRTNYYSNKGITQIEIIKYITKDSSFISHYLKLRCNLAKIMYKNDTLLLDDDTYTISELEKGFRKRLYEINEFRLIGIDKHPIECFKIKRVDFAIDLLVDNPSIYTYLCNMSTKHNFRNMKRTRIKKDYDTLYKESCHYHSKSRTLNIYSKHKAMINKGQQVPSAIEKQIRSTLRVEFQVKKTGVKTLNNKTGAKLTLLDIFNKDFCNSYIKSEISKFYSSNKYVTFNKAVEIINSSIYSKDIKTILISILRSIKNSYGLYNLQEAIKNNKQFSPKQYGDIRSFERRLKQIYDLGIQPVVIPDDFGIEELPSITTLIHNHINNVNNERKKNYESNN